MTRLQDRRRRDSSESTKGLQAPPGAGLLNVPTMAQHATRHALGLMVLRSTTIGAKFALAIFIARYLGLAPLGAYGIIASAAALAPVLLGFGVSNNLSREAVRSHPAAITARLIQYFAFLIPAYVGLCGLSAIALPREALWLCVLAVLLFLEHIQTDMFALMTITGLPYGANLILFIRSAGWVLVYIPLAILDPALRSLKMMGLFWLAGDVLATVLAVLLTSSWRWGKAIKALPGSAFTLPHRHGSTALYLNDVANTGFQYIDRYIIGIMLSPDMLGIYTLFWSVVNAVSSLITTAVVQPRRGVLVQAARSSTQSFNHSLRGVAIMAGQLTAGVSVIVIAFMYIATPYIHRPGLMAYFPILFLLSVATVFRSVYEVIGIAFYSYNRDDITLYSGAAIFIAALVLNVILVPGFGIWGASFVLLASYAIGVLVRAMIISRGFRPHTSILEGAPDQL